MVKLGDVNIYDIEKEITNCKTAKQVRDLLAKNNINIMRDKTLEMCGDSKKYKRTRLNIWLDDTTRIYYNLGLREYTIQKWPKVKLVPNGKTRIIPVCYGALKKINDYDIVEMPDNSIHNEKKA